MLEFFIQVKDNFNLNGRQHDWVPSGKLRVTIISHEQWDKKVQEVSEQIVPGHSSRSIRASSATRAKPTRSRRASKRRRSSTKPTRPRPSASPTSRAEPPRRPSRSAQKLDQLLQKMAENKSPDGGMKQTAGEVKKQLEQTADGPMREAAKELNDAGQAKPDPKASPEQQAKDAGAAHPGDGQELARSAAGL